MPASRSPLDRIRIASPCTSDWRFMLGNNAVRYCGQCNKNVYNLSAMTRGEAETLIRRMEGRLCVRYYMRRDGTIINADCPVGLRAVKQRVSRITTAIFALLISVFANIGLLSLIGKGRSMFSPVMGKTAEPPFEILGGMGEQPLIGAVFIPPTEAPVAVMGGAPMLPRTVFRSESFLRNRAITRVPAEFTVSGDEYKEGDAVVRLTISERGDVIEATYISGPPVLELLAEEKAREWKFKPLKIDGLPVEVEGSLTFPVKRVDY
jgi:hypothetical protein